MDSDCDLVSGSVTVVSCPSRNKYTVYLSEMLVNTTLSDIENEIIGVDDALGERYDEPDYIRVIEVENVNITSVKKSKEKASRRVADSVIVIVVNETESDPANNKWHQSVWRYS